MRNDSAEALDRARVRCVLPERNVRPRLIVIGSVFRKDSSKVLDVEHEQMIRALAPDRADQAFNIPILPGRVVRRGPVPDPHCSHTSLECNTECSVVVANEIFRCAVPRKRFGDLARKPLCRWVSGHRRASKRRSRTVFPWPRFRRRSSPVREAGCRRRAALIVNRIGKGSCETHGKRLRI
jgi:hypothetical protein